MPRFNSDSIRAMALDLEEGQEWDDVVPIEVTREQGHAMLAALSLTLTQMQEGIEDTARAAASGDIIAVLVGPKLVESANELHTCIQVLTATLLPSLWAEVQAVKSDDAAEAAAPSV